MKRGAKVCTIDAGMSRGFWVVDILALSTVKFNSANIRSIVLAHWQKWLLLAEYTRAFAEFSFLVFLKLVKLANGRNPLAATTQSRKTNHFCQSTRGNDIPSMDKAIEMTSGFLDLFPHLIIALEIKNIGHKV